ncbi:Carboxysome shell protein CsoS3 [hydrothermal vent metagenome]|uniref:Carboxysome shell carbonic anhydrase n=1 Tax=hydrothermal vent metagenome TaxID=652676 RepID=A0A3B0YT17_9ZZZZ
MFNTRTKSRRPLQRTQPVVRTAVSRVSADGMGCVPSNGDENLYLYRYEQKVKQAFANIESCLKRISGLQHTEDFISRSQLVAREQLGFDLPEALLADSWIKSVDIGQLYVWCVFETFRRFSDEFFVDQPLAGLEDESFQTFVGKCGFHTVDVSPCADGRLAHVIRYVLRLPYKSVRRKSYAGAMFDIDDSLQKWVETEMLRYRESRPNSSDAATRYLKVAVYHYSSSAPGVEGCAAHGSDAVKSAEGALSRLRAFQQGVENTFCCGASIDLLLIGVDTDNDVIRIHLPDVGGDIDSLSYVDCNDIYEATVNAGRSDEAIYDFIKQVAQKQRVAPTEGMLRFITKLFHNNILQVNYVREYYNGRYKDIGHQECFIGMGIGFEEIQLRNLTYFAYLKTVEEGAKDLDVGIKIFSGLNVSRGLPIPVIIRNDYHGQVPGARERAVNRCHQLDAALKHRFKSLYDEGMLHTLMMVRDCNADSCVETVGCSLPLDQ